MGLKAGKVSNFTGIALSVSDPTTDDIAVADNESPNQPPAFPKTTQRPILPPGMDAEEYRRFQEFVLPNSSTPPHGTASGALPAHHEIAEQLAGMRRQLTDLATTQATINRTINPALWRRILRSRFVHLMIWLGIIVIVASVGTPLLIDNLFADNNTDPSASGPPPKEKSMMPPGPHDAVADVYRYVSENNPGDACNGLSLKAELEFAKAANTATCELAVGMLARQVTDPSSYAHPNLRELPAPAGNTDMISSCEFTVTGGPRLGTFIATREVRGWEITDYFSPIPCPTPRTPTH